MIAPMRRFLALLLPLAALPALAAGDALGDAAARLGRGDAEGARAALLDLLRADPANARAHLLQGRAFLALGDGIAAEAAVRRAVALGWPAAESRHLLARAFLLQSRLDRAIDEAAAAAPAHAGEAAGIEGEARARLGDIEGATAAFRRALALRPQDADLLVAAGRFRRSVGDGAGALDAADRAVMLAPKSVPALLLKGELARQQFGLAAALPWFDRALGLAPRSIDALNAKAATLGDMGDAHGLLEATRAALAVDPRNARAFLLQAMLAARAGDFALAQALYARTGGALDAEPATMLLAGILDCRTGRPQQGIARLRRLLGLQPDNARVRRLVASAQWQAGDANGVIATLLPLAARPDADSYVLSLVGRAHERLGDRAAAAPWLDRAWAPGRPADAMLVADRPIAALRTDAELAPGDVDVQIALIRGLFAAGAAEEALERSVAVATAHPGAAEAMILVGDALVRMNRPADAAMAYRRAGNIAFTEPTALRLIDALRRAGRGEEALTVLNLYLAQNPDSVPALLVGGDVLMNGRRWPQAIAVYQRVRARIGDNDVALLNNLAWAWFGAGRLDRALPLAARAHGLMPANPALADSYGWMLAASGRRARGIALIRQAAAQAPGNAGVRAHLARLRPAG